MEKQIQLTLRKHKGSWLAKSRLGIGVFRSLNPTPEMCFENISAANTAGGRKIRGLRKELYKDTW